jgi:hypothetical protein
VAGLSDEEKKLKEDIIAVLLEDMGKKELWGSRPVYYKNIPLKPFTRQNSTTDPNRKIPLHTESEG